MTQQIDINDTDNHVDDEIFECLKLEDPKSFFLFAGAGSGKTRSLVNVLEKFKNKYGRRFELERRRVAIITYTNAAADEIKHRLKQDPIFHVSTIHSFTWELIKPFTTDIKEWIKNNLVVEIQELEEQQNKSRDLSNKTSVDRARKIESKNKRLTGLSDILKFTYNPNGDNLTKDSLNHSEVIKIAADFIMNNELMQRLIASKYPILLIDESQDTKKELIDAFFELQKHEKKTFTLGLFGDMMQRIYSDGKEKLEQHLPNDFIKPVKKMNHRSNKRIIDLVNDIRKDVDGHSQIPREEKKDGFVRLFICQRGVDKSITEKNITNKMAAITKDNSWKSDLDKAGIKTLILEHHMAARRMGFSDFFEPLYRESKLSTGLLDGSLSGANFFVSLILPLTLANLNNDQFELARIVKKYSLFLKKDQFLSASNQINNINSANIALESLLNLWADDADPLLIDIIRNVYESKLFPIPDNLHLIAKRAESTEETSDSEDEYRDSITDAWDSALLSPFSQIKNYEDYLLETSKFGTHQGVKGLEYPRVMVILDDEESRGWLFNYDKMFGSKELSANDKKNLKEGKETGVDRTKRLFYVACSRAQESLAIVAYTDELEIVKKNAIDNNWFRNEEIITITK